MSKTGFKAFVYSFSVSLLAILSAHRAFWHHNPSEAKPLQISNKNIVLFLKNTAPKSSPVKKIALTKLSDIDSSAATPPLAEDNDVILASNLEDFDFPLEIELQSVPASSENSLSEASALGAADVLYAPDKPLPPQKIEAEPVYQPEKTQEQRLAPPTEVLADKSAVYSPEPTPQLVDASIPLTVEKTSPPEATQVKLGKTQELNHVALAEAKVPIESMQATDISSSKTEDQGKWKPLDNANPWVIAQTKAGSKNKLAANGLGAKSAQDAAQVFESVDKKDGVQVASETVKNLIIPIPEKIMEDENLVPKLAYPSTSEDAVKEKVIDAKIKADKKAKEQKLLSAVDDDDVSLDAPDSKATEVTTPVPEKTATKKTLLGKLNSIFSSSKEEVSDTKQKALARAKARKSLKRRAAQTKPVSIMPTEIRLSFQPNRAEISGQTLRWVQAFATKAAESDHTLLEIRIDGTSAPALQQRRLNLLYNILTNKGVEYAKINTVFTSREPNSFILRTINTRTEEQENRRKINVQTSAPYIQW